MSTDDLDYVKEHIEAWGGEIAIDAYDLESDRGFAILSFLENGTVAKAIHFQGSKADLMILFTEILRKNLDKVVEDQRDEIESIEA